MSNTLVYTRGPVQYRVDVEKGVYLVNEPPLRPFEEEIVETVLDILPGRGHGSPEKLVEEIAEKLGIRGFNRDAVLYHVSKNLSPWGPLYPIIIDDRVEEVSASSSQPASIIHRDVTERDYLDTNIVMPDEEEFRAILQRIASAAGVGLSNAFPIAEAELNGNRVTIVLGVIANRSTISVRKQPPRMPSLEELVEEGVLTWEAAEYLLGVLRSRGMVFIVGPQGTGKTTLLNALLEKLPRDWKLVVVEDVPELRPRHPRFISLRVRRPRSLSESKELEIGYRELLRTALRMRGQFTGITEARGEEVLYLFEAAALGEASAATFHARDWRELRLRLSRLGVRDDMIGLLWAVVVMARVYVPGRGLTRRVKTIYEVTPEGFERLVYRYDSTLDRLVRVSEPTRIVEEPLRTIG